MTILSKREQFALAALTKAWETEHQCPTHDGPSYRGIAERMALMADAAIAELDRTAQTETAAEPEWIPWSGGDRPVHHQAHVDVKFRGGGVSRHLADMIGWKHCNSTSDIVGYRVVPS